MLTKKQSEVLNYIVNYIENKGFSPSFEEMKLSLNLKSKSGIHRLISGLEERGFVRRLPNKARALEIIKMPEQKINGKIEENDKDLVRIPFLGKIAAGIPIEAINNPSDSIKISHSMINPNYQHYALKVEGDSMIDLGILDNDVAVIQYTEVAENGSVVVALIDGTETTLKKFNKKDDQISLEPANIHYEIRRFTNDRVKIQGKLVAIYRLYN